MFYAKKLGKYMFYLFILLIAVLCLLVNNTTVCASTESERALEILDNWTSTHWGDNNLVWVVHYPEELIEPWVHAEAERRRFKPDQTDAYRKAFKEDLKIDSTTAVMLSIHAFDAKPLNLAPLAKNITLIDSSGKRITPIVFEKKLDNPLIGLVQGFVFFPKQRDSNFNIAIKGLVKDRETLFAFNNSDRRTVAINTSSGQNTLLKTPKKIPEPQNEVIVRIPTTKPSVGKVLEQPSAPPEPEFSAEGEIFEPTMPPSSHSSGDIVPELIQINSDDKLPETARLAQMTTKLSAKQVLDIYLKFWIIGDTEKMYSLLSRESQDRVSKELFEREVLTGGFRQALKNGYKVSWTENSAKITVAKKMLLMRTMNSKQINFLEEDGSSRVSW